MPWPGKYMLDNAGRQMVALHGASGYSSPTASLIVCLAYAAAALSAAAILITRPPRRLTTRADRPITRRATPTPGDHHDS